MVLHGEDLRRGGHTVDDDGDVQLQGYLVAGLGVSIRKSWLCRRAARAVL